jgi:hypothetical protein
LIAFRGVQARPVWHPEKPEERARKGTYGYEITSSKSERLRSKFYFGKMLASFHAAKTHSDIGSIRPAEAAVCRKCH